MHTSALMPSAARGFIRHLNAWLVFINAYPRPTAYACGSLRRVAYILLLSPLYGRGDTMLPLAVLCKTRWAGIAFSPDKPKGHSKADEHKAGD